MADEVMGMKGSFSVDTSQLNMAATQVQNASTNITQSLRKISSESQAAGSGLTNLGGKMMVVGQFADDMQYGLRAVVNQIPMLVTAFGGGMGLAGAIGIVAVAANQLALHWDSLISVFREGGTLTEAQRMEELGKKTEKTADEQKRLNEYKKEEQQIEQMLSGRPKRESESAAGLQAALNEGPPEEILEKLIKARQAANRPLQSNMHLTGELAQKEASLPWVANTREWDQVREEIKVLKEQIKETQRKDAARIMLRSMKDPTLLLDEMRQAPGIFSADDMERVRQATPDAKAWAEGEERREREGFEAAKKESDALEKKIKGEAEKFKKSQEQKLRDKLDAGGFLNEDELTLNRALSEESVNRKIDLGIPLSEREEAGLTFDMRNKRNQKRQSDREQFMSLSEQGGELNSRLQGLLRRGAMASNSFRDADAYEGSIKATGIEVQIKKQEEANKLLEQIRKNTEERQKIARRIAR